VLTERVIYRNVSYQRHRGAERKESCTGLRERFLEGGGRVLFEGKPEHITVGTEPLQSPGEPGLSWDAQRAASGDDPEQNAGAVSTFGAAGEEHVEVELGDVLELALGGRVVERYERVVDESEERVAVILVVSDRRRQRLGR
jgi:hypothetical protein